MTRTPKRPPARPAQRTGRSTTRPTPIDPFARKTIELFTTVMILNGYSRSAIAHMVRSGSIPPSARPAVSGSRIDLNDTGHILTLWSKDPDYQLPNGAPRPIPARGPAPSIEALVARVSTRLTFEEAWEQLERTATLQRIGRNYAPRGEAIIYLRDPALLAANTLRFLNACLQNLVHNAAHGVQDPWYLRTAQYTDFPRAEVKGYLRQSVARAMAFLHAEDSAMFRTARAAQAVRTSRRKPRGGYGRASINVLYSFIPAEESRKVEARETGPLTAPRPAKKRARKTR